MPSAVASRKRREFHAYGECARIFDWIDAPATAPNEVLCEGVAGGGKTRLIGEWISAVCKRFPNSKGIVVRETRVSLNDSFLAIWEDHVLGPDHPAVLDGPSRENRIKYEHPSLGGTVMLGGMDNPTRLFSTEYDWIYFNECQETTEKKWESLHRALRRSGTGFNVLLGDCNPESEDHFLNRRCERGVCLRLRAQFHDNPVYYDQKLRQWTEKGRAYISRLSKNLTGVRRKRLFEGLWVAATGQVLDTWDPDEHIRTCVLRKEAGEWWLDVQGWASPVRLRWFFGSHDDGYSNDPGVFQLWGVDSEGRMWRLKEVYRRGWMHSDWSKYICKVNAEYRMTAVVTDHNPALQKHLQAEFHAAGMSSLVVSADKVRQGDKEKAGIAEIRERLKRREDGTRGLYLCRDVNEHVDASLRDEGLPWRTEMEIPAWCYPEQVDGKASKEDPDPACKDDGIDSMRYAAVYARDRDHTVADRYAPRAGSLAATLQIPGWRRIASGGV